MAKASYYLSEPKLAWMSRLGSWGTKKSRVADLMYYRWMMPASMRHTVEVCLWVQINVGVD